MRLERLPRDRLPQSTVARGSLRTTSLEAGLIDSERRAAMVAATNDQANACTACTAVLGASTGAQVLSCPPLAAKPLDDSEQCCGLCLPTFVEKGSA